MDSKELLSELCGKAELQDGVTDLVKTFVSQVHSRFSMEHVSTYIKMLDRLDLLLQCIELKHSRSSEVSCDVKINTSDLTKGVSKETLALMVYQEVCIPCLKHIYPMYDSREDVLSLLGRVSALVSVCVNVNPDLCIILLDTCMQSIKVFNTERPTSYDFAHTVNMLDFHAVCEVLRCLLTNSVTQPTVQNQPILKQKLKELFSDLLKSQESISLDSVGSICVPVLVRILHVDVDSAEINVKSLWSFISALADNDRKQYILLCGFANFLFPVNGVAVGLDLRCETQFWKIIQSGLPSKDPGNRKRSMYLLKRIVDICDSSKIALKMPVSVGEVPVFWWDVEQCSALSKVWENFLLLIEVLEEKQIHVIKPLLPRMKNLIEAASVSTTGVPMLHTSWLTVLFIRCSHHESLQVLRWSVETVVTLDLTRCPMLIQGQLQFLCGPFLLSLREAKLFLREPGSPVGTQPVIAEMLNKFFPACWAAIPETDVKSRFLEQVLHSICRNPWGPIPQLYVSRALTFLPPTPCLNREMAVHFRTLLTGYLSVVSVYLRGAIQCFCLQIFTSMLDTSQISPEEFSQTLSLFTQEESIQRGTTLWKAVADWFKSVSESGADGWKGDNLCQWFQLMMSDYLHTTTESTFSEADTIRAQQIARFLLLASDASIATTSADGKPSTLYIVTDMLASVINKINYHAYMSTHKADKAIQMLVLIVTELTYKGLYNSSKDPIAKVISRCIESCQSELVSYLCKQITEGIHSLSDLTTLKLYTQTAELLYQSVQVVTAVSWDRLVSRCVQIHSQTTQLDQNSVNIEVKIHQLTSACMLGTISGLLSNSTLKQGTSTLDRTRQQICDYAKKMKVDLYFSKPTLESQTSTMVSNQDWGKVSSLYQQSQWQILQMMLDEGATCVPSSELLEKCSEALSVSSGETAVPVFGCIEKLLPETLGVWSDDNIMRVIEASWACVKESHKKVEYWSLLEGFVKMVYQPCLLSLDLDSPVLTAIIQIAESLISVGEERVGVANILTNQLCCVLSQSGMIDHCFKIAPVLVSLCMFGSVQKRWDRQWLDACASVELLGTRCSVTELKPSISNRDIEVRARVVSFLCKLNPANQSHRNLATEMVSLLTKAYNAIARDQPNKFFTNTKCHRQKHRLIQCVVLLESLIQETYRLEIWKFVWTSLEQENQPSVRHLLEWIAVFMATRSTQFGDTVWELFEKYRETKNMVLCSLLCVVIHLGPFLTPEQQEQFYRKALSYIVPWCMAHHFNTRIFAQATLVKLWEQCHSLQLRQLLDNHSILQTIVHFNQENRNSTKNVKKLLESFFFKALDFQRDFSVETLFDTLPRMTALSEEEWISPSLFEECDPAWMEGKGSCFIPLRNKSDHLKNSASGIWQWRGGLNSPEDDQSEEVTGSGEGDVQKKIMPWKQMFPGEEAQEEIEYGLKTLGVGGLIVVTSLIDKIPNLGGLCRSSEIFGVSEFVVGKLQYTEDKAFQSLSVTAHKWLPITEVSELRLPEYLLEKRQEGYTLVGVEQTANSISLTDYQFPVKTLLLLGNEKEGIPVELISLLDVCVEIPQQGVIRSLNVHVSGALLIWEYRRQQLVNQS